MVMENRKITVELPEGNVTRFDFGFAINKWTNWCQVDGKYFSGQGYSPEEANAQMLSRFTIGASLGFVKQRIPEVRALDGRTREGKLIKTASSDRIREEDRNKELKDLF